jgi:hypothetical protein
MKITKKIAINKSTEDVWKILAHNFDTASEWMSAIPRSYGAAVGDKIDGAPTEGRVCELDGSPTGIKAYEKILTYSEEEKNCTVDIELRNAPFIVPIKGNVVFMELIENGLNSCTAVWSISPKLKPLAHFFIPLVYVGLSVFVGQVLGELKYYAEEGKPHPRKIKATKKLELATNA